MINLKKLLIKIEINKFDSIIFLKYTYFFFLNISKFNNNILFYYK